MRLNLGIMICFALAAMIMAQKDFAKCSLKYLRKVAKESCERIHNTGRVKRDLLAENKDVFDFSSSDHRFRLTGSRDPLPPDAKIELKRTKRDGMTYDVYDKNSEDWVFYFCCDHMQLCESLPCEINE